MIIGAQFICSVLVLAAASISPDKSRSLPAALPPNPFKNFSSEQLAACGFVLNLRFKRLASLIMKEVLPLEEHQAPFLNWTVQLHNIRAARDMAVCGFVPDGSLSYCLDPNIKKIREAVERVADEHLTFSHCKSYFFALKWGSRLDWPHLKLLFSDEVELADYIGLWTADLSDALNKGIKKISEAPYDREIITLMVNIIINIAQRAPADFCHVHELARNLNAQLHSSFIVLPLLRKAQSVLPLLRNARFVPYSFKFRDFYSEEYYLQRWFAIADVHSKQSRASFFLRHIPHAILQAPLKVLLKFFQDDLKIESTNRNDIIVCKSFAHCKVLVHHALVTEAVGKTALTYSNLCHLSSYFVYVYYNSLPDNHKVRIAGPILLSKYWKNTSLSDADYNLMLKCHGIPAVFLERYEFTRNQALYKFAKFLATNDVCTEFIPDFHVNFLASYDSLESFSKILLDHNRKLTKTVIDTELANFHERSPDTNFVDCILHLNMRYVSQPVFWKLLAADLRCRGLLNCQRIILAELTVIETRSRDRLNHLRLKPTELPLEPDNDMADPLLFQGIELHTKDGNQVVDDFLKEWILLQDKYELNGIEANGLQEHFYFDDDMIIAQE